MICCTNNYRPFLRDERSRRGTEENLTNEIVNGKRILKLISHLFRSPSYDRFERVSNYIFHDNRTNGITCSYAFPYRISQIKITARYRRWSRWHFANEGGAGSLYTYVEVAQTRRVVHEEQNARTEREPGRIKGENFCRMDARWIYLICSNVRKPRNTLNSALNYRLLYIYIYIPERESR